MSHSAKQQTAQSSAVAPAPGPAPVPHEYAPYRRIYALVFQAWLIMFLGVICGALVLYLLSYIPR